MESSIKYQAVRNRFDRLVNGVKSDVDKLARKVFEKGLISATNLSAAGNSMHSEDFRASRLLQQILNKISESDQHFDTFVDILNEIPLLKDLANELHEDVYGKPTKPVLLHNTEAMSRNNCLEEGTSNSNAADLNTSITDSNTPVSRKLSNPTSSFQCRCGQNCSFDTFVGGRCLGPLNKIFPNLNVKHLSESDEDRLIRKLTIETRAVIELFDDLVCHVFSSLEKRKVSIKQIRAVALTCGKQSFPKPLQESHRHDLANVTDIYDVQSFLVEHNYISFLNYGILKNIIKHLGGDDDKKELKDYLRIFGEFCKRSVFEVPPNVIAKYAPVNLTEKLVIKVNEKLWFGASEKSTTNEFTMEDMYEVEENLAKVIGLDSTHILIRDVRKGCVEFSLSILPESELLSLDSWQKGELSKLGINVTFFRPHVSNTFQPQTEKFPIESQASVYTEQPMELGTESLEPKSLSSGFDALSRLRALVTRAVMNVDARGVARGGCNDASCGCTAYDGGGAGMKCLNCGHPPAKHQKYGPGSSSPSSVASSVNPVQVNSTPYFNPIKTLQSLFNRVFGLSQGQQQPQQPAQPTQPVQQSFLRAQAGSQAISESSSLADAPDVSSSSLPPGVKKCAIQECPNPCYVDDSGTVHECCGYTHAMEHQRRQALLQQVNQQVVKGVTHCYLPGCNRPIWPFHNYCGKTHAEQGKLMGLPPPPSLATHSAQPTATSGPKDSSMCIIPECYRKKYVDPQSGVTHDYCGKTHAQEGARRGIRATADKVEDRCEFPGCTNKKRTEGTRVHNYCCLDHAQKDAPNRDARMLASFSQVQSFLKQFSNLNVVSIDENPHAKPGGTLFQKFKKAYDSLPSNQHQTQLAFHGTSTTNIDSICKNGYDPGRRRGQAYGAGEYFATTPDTPLSYCQGGKMLLNELLLGQAGTHHTQHSDIIVMKNPDHDLPRFVIAFSGTLDT